MKTIKRIVVLALACGLQAGMGAAWAQDGLVKGDSGGVTYVSGGIGQEQRDELAASRADFNLRLTFATRGNGEMRADVALAIADARGNPVLTLDNAGPQVYIKLPRGAYQVTATVAGMAQRRSVSIGASGARELSLYWAASADRADAADAADRAGAKQASR